jgi:hypothetical protein
VPLLWSARLPHLLTERRSLIMAMSRKHYREAAETVREAVEGANTPGGVEAASDIARGLADMFKRDDPKFRYDTFYAACGLNEWGKVK